MNILQTRTSQECILCYLPRSISDNVFISTPSFGVSHDCITILVVQHSIFIGFAPKEDPKIAVAVYVENSGFGATWAVPIASLMIEKYLNDTICDSRRWLEQRMLDSHLDGD